MKTSQTELVLLHLILLLCGALGSLLGVSALYYAAMLVFPCVAALVHKRQGNVLAPLRPPSAEGLTLCLPLLPWILLVTVLAAYLSSLWMEAMGLALPTLSETSFGLALLRHALLPALLEELFFRYLPLLLLPKEKPRTLVLIGALLFALAHLSLYQLPYALVAGVLYALLALLGESLLPCVLLHLANNALSVCTFFFGESTLFVILLAVGGTLLLLLSLLFLLRNRAQYVKRLREIFPKGERISLEKSTIVYAIFTLLLTILSIL